MPLDDDTHRQLLRVAKRIRYSILDIVYAAGSGHVGSALSQTDILVALYYRHLRVRSMQPDWRERDRFVLSKGHGGLGLAAILADLGFVARAELAYFGDTGHRLGMHMDHMRVPGLEISSGSLGHGLGVAVGFALGARVQQQSWRTVCLLSDGELYEGSVWEAAIAGAGFSLGRLLAIVDRNRLTMDGFTETEMPLEPVEAKWAAFGWRTWTVDGHDFSALCSALDDALGDDVSAPDARARPGVIIANTVKGRGVRFMEDAAKWHYGALDSAMYERAKRSVAAMYAPYGV